MENLILPETAWQLIAGLITLFGTVITLLLGILGWFARRYVSQIDVRLKETEEEVGVLKLGQTTHMVEIKNIHHRLKEI